MCTASPISGSSSAGPPLATSQKPGAISLSDKLEGRDMALDMKAIGSGVFFPYLSGEGC